MNLKKKKKKVSCSIFLDFSDVSTGVFCEILIIGLDMNYKRILSGE